MIRENKRGLQIVTLVFWVLLLYIIAALVWWFFSLQKQNLEIHKLRTEQAFQSAAATPDSLRTIDLLRERNTKKYIGEGVTFLLLILVGAVYIYRLVRKQFRLQQQQQNFVMAVTHELKTPVSVARLNLETLQKHQLPPEKQQRLMKATLEETLRLDTLINNVLLSSQLDSNVYNATKEELDLSSLLLDVVRQFSDRYPDRKIKQRIEPDLAVEGDPFLLKLLGSNLLENANKYSAKEKMITCLLTEQDGYTSLQIIDEGIGVPNGEKAQIFEKFYRVGSEETRRTKGTGLGLYISKKIAQFHNATIAVTDSQPQGTNFTVRFKSLSI